MAEDLVVPVERFAASGDGFGAGRGYPFEDFFADAAVAGWATDLLLSTWDLRPFTPDADFLVAILRPA